MAEINILPQHLADLIAAGEVVERPASVIKELTENSIDAGAHSVTVEIKNGGMSYIRVTDDGAGMLPEDAGICFLRHATSKLRDEKGLERIATMGFRGEALAAIAAVSKIELLTRKRGESEGTRVLVDAGSIVSAAPCGCPEGTTFIVRELFHNTPARQKFMKSDKAEAAACTGLALRCALGAPGVSVRFIRDEREEFFSPGNGKLDSCVYSLLGRETAGSFLPLKYEDEGLKLSGFAGSPAAGHGNRAKQFFFCNGRPVRSLIMQSALEQAYKNTLLTGRYPACAIWLEISPAQVDVNVHPAKIEVKFREERRVFDAVYHSVLASLGGERAAPEIKLSQSTKAVLSPKKDFFRSMTAEEFRGKASPTAEKGGGTILINRTPSGDQTSLHEAVAPYFVSGPKPAARQEHLPEAFLAQGSEPGKAETKKPEAPPLPEPEAPPDFRLVGEAMKTYIIAETGDRLILIDKHAAHERVIFDKLKKYEYDIMSQSLISPVTVRVSAYDVELVEQNAETLLRLGLELERFGEDSLILRALPAETDEAQAVALVEELCEKLRRGEKLSPRDKTDEILHTIACKAAIKSGWNTTSEELKSLVAAVVSGEVKYCPHGRPVAITLTKAQLDKEFSRIV